MFGDVRSYVCIEIYDKIKSIRNMWSVGEERRGDAVVYMYGNSYFVEFICLRTVVSVGGIL